MAKFLKGVVPATLDPDALQFSVIGEFFIDRASVDNDGKITPTAYVALEENGVKKLFMISGAGKYELLEHLARAHVIGNSNPTNFDRSTIWYNTQLVYVEPSDVRKAYISVRVEKSPGQWEWQKIMPFVNSETVILGKDSNGEPVTLATLIKNNRVINNLPKNIREAGYGELYVNDSDELFYKDGPNPEDQRLIGTVNGYLRERLIELIKVGKTAPLNFNYNSVWFTDDGDISLSRSKYINLVDPSKSTGLKFERDAQNKIKGASTLENEHKSVIIDNNSTTDFGHIWLNYPFNENGKFYLEISILDENNKANIMFLGNGVQQPALNDYGTQIDGSQALVTTEKLLFKGATTTKAFPMHKKTIFIEVTKLDSSCDINIGYITDSGEKRYIHGDNTTAGITMNLSRIAVGSNASTDPNSSTRFSILPFLIKKIPDGFKGINNTLPGENAFQVVSLATNAESVFLSKNVKLADQVESGRIIPVFRDYTDKDNSRINEIMLDSDRGMLYTKLRNNSVVPIVGRWDDTLVDHIQNSLKVTSDDVNSFTRIASDPRRIYITKKPDLPTNVNKIIVGNMAVVDNSPEGKDKEYKLVIPRTTTYFVEHTWNDGRPQKGALKTYLDELDELVRNALSKDNVYSGYEEVRFRKSDLINTYNTQQSFVQELSRRMLDNSLYIETIEKLPAGGVSSNQIDNFFDVPESGILYGYADSKDNFHATLLTKNNLYYKTFYKPSYSGASKWRRVIIDIDGLTSVNKLNADSKITSEGEIESKESLVSPLLKITGNSGSITANGNNITNNSANLLQYEGSSILDTLSYTIGDKKFRTSQIISKNRPQWIDEDGNEHNWLLTEDIRNAWNYKGRLLNSGSYTDLNTLTGPTTNGYYTSPNISTEGYNYPSISETGLLHNYQISNELSMQLFFSKDSDGHRLYMRTNDGTNWSPWNSMANNVDMSKKLSLTGGTITGNLTVDRKLTAKSGEILSLINDRIVSSKNYQVLQAGVLGTDESVVVGDGNYKMVVLVNNGEERPRYYNGTKYQYIVVEDDLELLRLSLNKDYYNKKEVDNFLSKKVDGVKYTTDMKNKVSRSGDTMLGTLTMTAGDIEITQGSLKLADVAKISLPGKTFENVVGFNNESLSKYNNTLRYDTVTLGTDNEQAVVTISSGLNTTTTTNTPTSIQFTIDKKGVVSVNAIVNKALKTPSRTILMRDEIVNDYTGGYNKVLSAEKGKELNESTIGRYRGTLYEAIGVGSVYNPSNLTTLNAGYYQVSTNNEIKSLGLDETVIKNNNGILIVEGQISTNSRSYRYITKTDQSEQFVLAMKTLTNGSGEWKYVYDISAYYTKAEIDDLLRKLESRILNRFVSSKFKFTGYHVNNSIPEKLVHTHNHESLGDSDTLYFKTNLTATTVSESKNFVIRLKGFSMGSASTDVSSPIDIIISGRIENTGSALPVLKNANVVNMIPGSSLSIGNMKITIDGYLTYSVKDKVSNRQLSFDTYMRFSSIADIDFQGEILLYRSTAIQ